MTARADEPVPDLDEVQAILDRHGITRDAIEAQIDAEQAGIAEGVVVPLTTQRRRSAGTPRARASERGQPRRKCAGARIGQPLAGAT